MIILKTFLLSLCGPSVAEMEWYGKLNNHKLSRKIRKQNWQVAFNNLDTPAPLPTTTKMLKKRRFTKKSKLNSLCIFPAGQVRVQVYFVSGPRMTNIH